MELLFSGIIVVLLEKNIVFLLIFETFFIVESVAMATDLYYTLTYSNTLTMISQQYLWSFLFLLFGK